MANTKVEGIEEFIQRMTNLGAVPALVTDTMSKIAHGEMLQGAARHTRTGALYDSLYRREIPGGWEVGHDPERAPHAPFVVFGTRPHVILPKNGKFLRWFGPSGKPIFSKKVNHPGYIGDNYRDRAAKVAVSGMASIVDNFLKKV